MCKVLMVLGLILGSQQSFSSTENLSDKLMELRAEVQSVADQLESEKKLRTAAIQSLTIEKGELESRKKLLSMQNKEMQNTLQEKEQVMKGLKIKGLEVYPELVSQSFLIVKDYIKNAIPFKQKERLEKIDKINEQFKKSQITSAEYFEKYWSLLQSELRLSEGVEIQNELITIGAKDYQVKVLKLGMHQMYFQTFDGELGYAQKKGLLWDYAFFKEESLKSGVRLAFEAKAKNVKGGTYSLPLVQNSKSTQGAQNDL